MRTPEEIREEMSAMSHQADDGDPDEHHEGEAEGDDDDDVKKLFKQMSSLQKQIESLDISKSVKEESENRLRKMGFKEENGLQKPQLNNVFGADETPIKKAQTVNDVVDQLTNLSYKELRKKGENIKNAILRTGAQRLRPVLLTTLTTLLPPCLLSDYYQ